MIVVDGKGNELLDIIDVNEADADKKYAPINHCLLVVKVDDEYGGLYGITLPKEYLSIIEEYRTDKEEVEKLAFYSEIKDKEIIAIIDEKLLEYWK